MVKEMEQLHTKALEARAKLQAGQIKYEEALIIVNDYIKAANIKGKEIAKQFGVKHKDIDPRGFLR